MTVWTAEPTKEIADAHFRNHVVEQERESEIVWAEPNSSDSRVVYRIVDRQLTVSGDLGYAMYMWSQSISWPFLAGLELDYFASKCEASEVGRGFEVWSEQAASKRLTAIIAGWKDDVEDADVGTQLDEIEESIAGALGTQEEWAAWVRVDPKRYDRFWELGTIGMDFHPRCVLHLEGIKRAWKHASRCTGIAARWCPIHGDCECREEYDHDDEQCPLHSVSSTHAEHHS